MPSRLSPEERAHVEAQLDELTATYNQLCDSSTQQLQQLEQQLAKEEERKVDLCGGFRSDDVLLALGKMKFEKVLFMKCRCQSEYACELSVWASKSVCVVRHVVCSQSVHKEAKTTSLILT